MFIYCLFRISYAAAEHVSTRVPDLSCISQSSSLSDASIFFPSAFLLFKL